MRFKIDENLPAELAELLRVVGYDAATVVQEGLGGKKDAILHDRCRSENRIFVTLDLDFSNIHLYPPQKSQGIIVLRLKRQDIKHVLRAFQRIIPFLEKERLENRLWIVEEYRVRIHEEPER